MDNSTYPGTETDISDNNCGFLASSSQEIDIVDHWVNLTIEDEVLRGCKLRKEKSKTCVPHSLCRLATRSNSRSPFSDDRFGNLTIIMRPLGRKPSFRWLIKEIGNTKPTEPNADWSESKSRCQSYLSSYEDSPQAFCYSPRSRSIKSKCVPRCPLRIAELAIPTKRQCIENWRTKCDILPPFMVERLKQQVMDEKPIAHIADAVNCFKRGKSHKGKSPKSTRLKKSDRSSRQMSNERMSELRKLCAIFGKKIAQKLITPQNLKLNPELDKISKIVADEVANMMKTGEYKVDNMNDKMRAEISEKIAVWISTVMEDTSYKLLEEDLRVKRYNEMSNKEERLLTLVKLLPRSERTSELEEEEGPVLDFLDDVFDKVMNICNPQEIDVHGDYSDKTSKASGENNLADSLENNYFDTSTPHDTWDYMTINKSDSKLTIGDIQNEIYKVIESVVRDDTEEDEPLIDLVGKEDLSNLVPNEVINSTHAVDEQLDEPLDYYTKEIAENSEPETVDVSKEIAESSEPETVDVSKVMPVEDFIVASENLGLDNNPVDDSEGLKPDDKSSDVIGIIAEESNDDKYKKVQFSDIDLGVRGRLDKNGTPVPNNDDMNNLEATFTNIGSRDILFQPPNENLLSDADEAWPENLTAPFLKATASVSKSVTSLGNITENDEKLSTVFQENELKDLSNKQEDIQDFNKINTTEKYDKLFNELLTKTPGVINEKANDEVAYSQQLPQNDGNKDNLTGATIERIDKLPETSTAAAGYSMDYPNILQKGKTTHLTESQMSTVGDESSTNVFYQAVQQKMKTSYALSEPKFDFKVDPNTAPSWLRHDHGKGEPSEDSIIGGCRPKGKLKECELRVWCKDLERMFSNLNLWNSWLETTTKNIYCLKQTRAGNIPEMKLLGSHSKSKSAREWITLKKNIDKDANLWTKLYERANIKLKSYKRRWLWEERTEVRAPLCFHINNVVLETMEDIDRMSLWIHRTIVSTEYCMLCDCKNNFVKRKL